jgi:Tfp pilus assembly protein PilF
MGGETSKSTTSKPKNSSSASVPAAAASSSHVAAKATTTASSSETTKNAGRNTALVPKPARRMLQNFLLIWLDANFDESKEDFKKSIENLRRIVTSITTFTDTQECIDFLSAIKEQKVFMIISGSLGRTILPEIQDWPQLESVYVFCGDQSFHEQWARKISKVKGVHTKIDPICEALQIDRENCDRAMISISFNGIDALFMYTQLLKECVLEIEDDDKTSIKELIDYCRLQDDISKDQIDIVEQKYPRKTPIYWYTAPYFMYSMLNRALRVMDVNIILKMAFFIRHLHQHINELYHEQQQSSSSSFTVFRGQGLSSENFEKMNKTLGGLMSFNNFLSTSRKRNISLNEFARPEAFKPDTVGILFVMNIDPKVCATSSIPFADVTKVGFFDDREEEILFTTHTIFRIDRIQRIEDKHTDRLWQVNLTLTGENDNHKLTTQIRKELSWTTGWSRLGDILIKLGESSKAEQLYKILLDEKVSSDKDRADYNNQLGTVYDNMGEYSKALSSYERSLEIQKIALPPNHPDLATSYNNIGAVYYNMGEYSKALSSYERSLEIYKIALPPNHPSLATSYNNIGSVYRNMGEYSKALSFYERSLEIQKIALPPNHPDLAASYNNIGLVYRNMGEYSKALSYYEKAQQIWQKSLPPTHPHIALVKNNIENVKKKL